MNPLYNQEINKLNNKDMELDFAIDWLNNEIDKRDNAYHKFVIVGTVKPDSFVAMDNRNKSDQLRQVLTIIENYKEPQTFEIDFDGNVKALIEINNNIPFVKAAMNGYGESISIENVTTYNKTP